MCSDYVKKFIREDAAIYFILFSNKITVYFNILYIFYKHELVVLHKACGYKTLNWVKKVIINLKKNILVIQKMNFYKYLQYYLN